MTAKQLIPLFLLFLVVGCTVTREYVYPQTGTTSGTPTTPGIPTTPNSLTNNPNPSGEWKQATGGAGGFTNYDTFKNFQYTFDIVGNNQPISIQLTSADINVQYALFDPLGQQIDVQGQGRSVGQTYTLNAGTYRVAVTADRQAVGRFSLSLNGTKAGATLIASQVLQSGKQSWGPLGSGGADFTYRNPFFTFDATDDNTSVDIELESTDTDVNLSVFDPMGQVVVTGSGSGLPRSIYTILKLNKGTYSVMAGTLIRGTIGNFNLRITGKVANLTKVESQSVSVQGTWANGKSFDTYSLDLTPNTSTLDISLTSAETVCQIDILDGSGNNGGYTTVLAFVNNFLVTKNLAKGTYQIKVYPGRVSGTAGNYKLDVFGKFTNFKKL